MIQIFFSSPIWLKKKESPHFIRVRMEQNSSVKFEILKAIVTIQVPFLPQTHLVGT